MPGLSRRSKLKDFVDIDLGAFGADSASEQCIDSDVLSSCKSSAGLPKVAAVDGGLCVYAVEYDADGGGVRKSYEKIADCRPGSVPSVPFFRRTGPTESLSCPLASSPHASGDKGRLLLCFGRPREAFMEGALPISTLDRLADALPDALPSDAFEGIPELLPAVKASAEAVPSGLPGLGTSAEAVLGGLLDGEPFRGDG